MGKMHSFFLDEHILVWRLQSLPHSVVANLYPPLASGCKKLGSKPRLLFHTTAKKNSIPFHDNFFQVTEILLKLTEKWLRILLKSMNLWFEIPTHCALRSFAMRHKENLNAINSLLEKKWGLLPTKKHVSRDLLCLASINLDIIYACFFGCPEKAVVNGKKWPLFLTEKTRCFHYPGRKLWGFMDVPLADNSLGILTTKVN